MIVVCSGEGISDLGSCSNQTGSCQEDVYVMGPLAVVIDHVIEETLHYSPRHVSPGTYRYFSEGYLTQRLKQKKSGRKGFVLPGKKHGVETGLFYHNAWMLAEIAKEIEVLEQDQAIAVLFRDSDGTNSAPADIWKKKLLSIEEGFIRGEFTRGVPMVPRPKSETWFLCAMKENPYQHCASLENLSGNDNSPNSAKRILSDTLQTEPTAAHLLDWLENNRFLHSDMASQMPSFYEFYQRVQEVLRSL